MAYLLDTNILSELRKRDRAAASVVAWYAGVDDTDLFLSVLVLGEIRRGVELRRRHDPVAAQSLERWLDGIIRWYRHRILPVTAAIARRWGSLCVDQPLPITDGLLAATALHHDLVFVTRNVDDVTRAGVRLLNPF